MKLKDTGERLIVYDDLTNSPHYLRHKIAYVFAEKFIRDKYLLDNGTGSGYGAYHLATNGAKKVAGVDISKEAIEYARHKYITQNLEFQTEDSTELSFADETFDVLTSFQVIEHIRDIDKFLLEARRVLKKQGVALISTPNKKTYSPNTADPENPFHVKEFYLDEFYEPLKTYFDEVEILGISQSSKVEQFEKSLKLSFRKRVENLLKKLHLLFLLNMIPKRMVSFFSRHLNKIDISDFSVTNSDIENSLDFIAICKKHASK